MQNDVYMKQNKLSRVRKTDWKSSLISKVSCENVELIDDESLKSLVECMSGEGRGVCRDITVLDWAQISINRITVLYFTLVYSYFGPYLLLHFSHNISTAISMIIVQNALNII